MNIQRNDITKRDTVNDLLGRARVIYYIVAMSTPPLCEEFYNLENQDILQVQEPISSVSIFSSR